MKKFGIVFAAVAFASALATSGSAGTPSLTEFGPVQTKVGATAALVRCDIAAVKACWRTCPTDTVENYEACRDQCYIDVGCT